mmetsp:Transcript_14768/g.16922  ORF Transcript_14768/g.16922 Transcript_14768/m.16922 type:complete len:281 (+) Transcript_14768:22-864(+)
MVAVIESESMVVQHEPTLQTNRGISSKSCSNNDNIKSKVVFVSNPIATTATEDCRHHHHYGVGNLLTQVPSPTTKLYGGDDYENCSLTSTSSSVYSSSSSSSSSSSITPTVSSSENDECNQQKHTHKRRVHFSNESKNKTYYVEQIYPEDRLDEYFYSYEDTQRFRKECILERQVLNELGTNELSHYYEDKLQHLHNYANNQTTTRNGGGASSKHKISRVVVLYLKKMETFCVHDPRTPPQEQQRELQQQESLSSQEKSKQDISDIFDNDCFWNGSILYC